ncbi:uncharacterized protein LOC130441140 [Diorhabda sublineata]|uniref:uncharacterized protein LOC130441140 n=1 Tax=Diorhabda sublineata TaxID=1163346 RepID=UPI0024E136CF|nr:uncharacterized protein LOC130441140 [Diorhabda sublineata]
MSSEDILDIIIQKLSNNFQDDPETFARVIFYLTEEKETYQEQDGPAFKMLKSVLNVDFGFKQYAGYLAEDTKRAERDENFKRLLGLIYSQMMDGAKTLEDIEISDSLLSAKDFERMSIDITSGFIRAIASIPAESQFQMIVMINNISRGNLLSRSLVRVVNTVNKFGANKVTVALAAIYLSPKIITAIREWWNNDITGKRCCKIIIDDISTVAGGIGGGYAGALLGACVPLGPVGIIAGGIIGGLLGGEALNCLSDCLTREIFNIPKDKALENAYVYFGVNQNSSNIEINTAYREKCLQHHPDKGGKADDFHKVQIHMATIKAAKGQLYN